jgi:hypothetical protein
MLSTISLSVKKGSSQDPSCLICAIPAGSFFPFSSREVLYEGEDLASPACVEAEEPEVEGSV